MQTAPDPPTAGFNPADLIKEYQAGIWRYLRALGCESSLAEDLTQETFLHVLQRPFQEINPAATAAYLRKIALNLFISYQRRAGKVVVMEAVEEIDRSWTSWAGNDSGEAALDALRECIKGLTERARMALELRFREDCSRDEIASALEITEHGAKNLMQRAKQQLRACVENKINIDQRARDENARPS